LQTNKRKPSIGTKVVAILAAAILGIVLTTAPQPVPDWGSCFDRATGAVLALGGYYLMAKFIWKEQ